MNPGNELCGILVNETSEKKAIQVTIGGEFLAMELPPDSFDSIIFSI